MSDARQTPRHVFGTDPAAYAAGRPGYPAEVFEILTDRCGLGPGAPTLEIGPGTGQATAELLARGAQPLTVVEPDPALAAYLRDRFGARIVVANVPFEGLDLRAASVRLAVSATAWHWVDQDVGLRSVAHALEPGGWWACWWTLFHDPDDPDELFEALKPILDHVPALRHPSTSGPPGSFALETEARITDLESTGAFDTPQVDTIRWRLTVDAVRARGLFGTFSPILALPSDERDRVLDSVASVIDDRFGGSFTRTCVTILYTARRR